MSVTVKGVPQLRARIEGLKHGRKDLTRQWALRTTLLAKQKHRPNKKTGVTSASIAPRAVTTTGAEVKAGGAAVYLERGTRPHVIRPRNAKALAFAPRGTGRLSGRPRTGGPVIFAKRVNHPGSRAYPFLGPAAREALGALGAKVLIDAWNDAA